MYESLILDAAGMLMFGLFIFICWHATDPANQRGKTRMDYLMERMDQLLANLRDLKFEYLAGRYLEEEFLTLGSRLEREAERLLVEIIDSQRAKN